MLYTRYNENGSKALCEKEQLKQLEEAGYKYEDNPSCNSEITQAENVKAETKIEEPVKTETKKPTRRTRTKKDIILE